MSGSPPRIARTRNNVSTLGNSGDDLFWYGLMIYSFARIGAALGMVVEDVYTQNRRLWVRLRGKAARGAVPP